MNYPVNKTSAFYAEVFIVRAYASAIFCPKPTQPKASDKLCLITLILTVDRDG
jgi:hypothetical protein